MRSNVIKNKKIETVMTYEEWKKFFVKRTIAKIIKFFIDLFMILPFAAIPFIGIVWWVIFGY